MSQNIKHQSSLAENLKKSNCVIITLKLIFTMEVKNNFIPALN